MDSLLKHMQTYDTQILSSEVQSSTLFLNQK